MYPFFFKIVHYYVRQDRIFVDMSHFLKMAVLSPILSTIRLSAIALVKVASIALYQSPHRIFFLYSYQYPQSH